MLMLTCALSLFCLLAISQTVSLKGKISDEDGYPISGATIRIKGKKSGVISKEDGTFSIPSPAGSGGLLMVSAIGFVEQEMPVNGQADLAVTLKKSNKQLDEVVVTAYGIKRDKNTLPYAAQTISGDEANKTRVTNIAAGLSGKVSGLQIIQNNAIGGSVNVVIRGAKSLSGNNQALFVIDGVPFDNTIVNSSSYQGPATGSSTPNPNSTASGVGGYDYGNAASDINPDDIASINVLKGAAATALYGSRAANGVIMITTKKGKIGMNVSVNSGITVGQIDKSTFVKLQHEYGAGRSDVFANNPTPNKGFLYTDVNGDGIPDLAVNTVAPRSWGPKFDPSLKVYQWDAFDPKSPTYHQATPWVAGANGPDYFYKTAISNNNSVYLDGASDKGSYKLGYTRTNDKGVIPNSTLTRNQVNFSATYKLTDRVTASATANYAQDDAIGRYATGYDGNRNPNVIFRQYGQTNVDYKEQKEAYFRNNQNITWNWSDVTKPNNAGIFAGFYNNIYWNVYQNYENDSRNRIFGNAALNYQVTDWLNIMGRVSIDSWNMFAEERGAVTSATTSFYTRTNSNFQELNYDLLATGTHKLSENFKLNELLGVNMRRDKFASIYQTTNGGLVLPGLYDIANSKSSVSPPYELNQPRAVDGYFGGATLTYRDFLTLDGTFRRDRSSTLPVGANAYNYYAISGSWVFFQNLKNVPWLSSGKLRANYATVGNDAPVQSVADNYVVNNIYGSSYLYSLPTTKNNNNLKPERTNSKEVGVEVSFLKNRVGLDVSYYHTNSINQIVAAQTSSSVGYQKKFINAGNIENQGFEVSLFATPVKTRNFSWDINVNWTRNRNKVLYLNEGSSNLVLGSFQGGVTLNATVGQPYGILQSQSYLLTNGRPTVSDTGLYIIPAKATNIIGNVNPDWIGGITNTFRYKDFSLSFLIDIRQGGSVFSLDQYYGQMSGILPSSVGNNDLGNPKRLPVAQGGGVILPGVKADGKVNTTRITITSPVSTVYPQSNFVYDASYVKLRELSLTYHLPIKVLGSAQKYLKGVDFSLLGRNLWLIHKNLPMADPEENLSAGNLQGYQSGAYPTVRTLGLNVKLKF
jgi:TonB-linked SusC/RagA family outer membrane protein